MHEYKVARESLPKRYRLIFNASLNIVHVIRINMYAHCSNRSAGEHRKTIKIQSHYIFCKLNTNKWNFSLLLFSCLVLSSFRPLFGCKDDFRIAKFSHCVIEIQNIGNQFYNLLFQPWNHFITAKLINFVPKSTCNAGKGRSYHLKPV